MIDWLFYLIFMIYTALQCNARVNTRIALTEYLRQTVTKFAFFETKFNFLLQCWKVKCHTQLGNACVNRAAPDMTLVIKTCASAVENFARVSKAKGSNPINNNIITIIGLSNYRRDFPDPRTSPIIGHCL